MKNFLKVVRVGTSEDNDIFAKIEYTNGNLSISGVEVPTRGSNAKGSAGQIIMSYTEYDERGYKSIQDIIPAQGWTREMIQRFFDAWDKWHLNDTRAGCQHQRGSAWDTTKKIETRKYTWSKHFHELRRRAESGKMSEEEYTAYTKIYPRVMAATIETNAPEYESDEVRALLSEDLIKLDKAEKQSAGWVRYSQHPEGLLCKPCEVCGYEYGSRWNYEEIPSDVVEFLQSLPNTDKQPAWV